MSQRFVAARSGSASLATAHVTLTVLTATLLVSMARFPNLDTASNQAKSGAGCPSISAQAAAQASQVCPLTSLPSTSPTRPNWGPSSFNFVGTSTACAGEPRGPGCQLYRELRYDLGFIETPLLITLGIAEDNNTTTSVPAGTTYSTTVGTQSVALSDNQAFSKPTLVHVPTGERHSVSM